MADDELDDDWPDPLFDPRNSFYLGAYRAVIDNGDSPELPPYEAIERRTLVFRSHIALGNVKAAIDGIYEEAACSIYGVKLLALYLVASDEEEKEAALAKLKDWLICPGICDDYMIRLAGGIIYMYEEDYSEALKVTGSGGTMEHHALNVQMYIKMHRLDYAEKELRTMQQIEEDHTLTQLASAWINLAEGGSRIQEAYLIYQDFAEKLITCFILNGKAVCCMHMGEFEEAETLLLEALDKDARDPETIANLVVCCLHLGKSSSRFLDKLKRSHPKHLLVKRIAAAEENFERALQSYA